jgi:predicted nucleic acid-binding protein
VIVIDASAMVEVLLGKADISRLTADESWAAPHLLDAEVGHALRRRTLITKELSHKAAIQALEDYSALEVSRYDHPELLGRAWQHYDNLSFYDALYVALAEMLDVPLVTVDARIATAPGVEALVEILPIGA